MKIDLHMHTKATLDSEPKTRNIKNPEDFKKTLINSKIIVAAITNHNEFDEEQYKELKDKEYLLLPGIEYDVNISDGKDSKIRKQLNIIFDPKKTSKFAEKVKNNHSSSNNPIDFQTIIEVFDDEDTIFYIDCKNTRTTGWTEQQYKENFSEVKGVKIFDANNQKTLFLLRSRNYDSLIGSDVQNWEKYEENYSKKLTTIGFKVNNFKTLLGLLRQNIGQEYDFESTSFKEINIGPEELNKKMVLKKISIANGVNIIFGPKASGKTELLEKLYNLENGTKTLYKSSDYIKNFNSIKENKVINSESTKEKIEEFKEIIKEISNYESKTFKNFKDFKIAIEQKNKIKIHQTNIKNIIKKDNKKIFNLGKDINTNLVTIKEICIENIYKKNFEVSKETLIFLKKKYLKDNKEFLKFKIKHDIKKNLTSLIEQNKGEKTLPTNIGLFKKYEERIKIKNNLEKLKKFDISYEEKENEYKIPDDSNVWIHKKIISIWDVNNDAPFGHIKYKNILKERRFHSLKETWKNGLRKLISLKPLSNPQETLSNVKKLIDAYEHFIVENVFENKENKNSQPSNGEKAYIALYSKLNEDVNTYFLDEPGVFLGNKMISENLLQKIINLNNNNKTIVITTHIASIGINTMPYNLIFRNNIINENGIFKTYQGNFINEIFENVNDNNDKLKFYETLINNFEGNIKQFDFRKGIYKNNDETNN